MASTSPTTGKAHPARWWHTGEDGRILCTLCPRRCRIREGQAGFCYIRQNHGGVLVSIGYGRPTGIAADPIEKKPLNHFMPGTSILSFGTAGCNLGCKFCQNWDISKAKLNELNSYTLSPDDIVRLARKEGCDSIAFTYNDPVIFGEYVVDVSKLAREAGLKSVMVTAGYITEEARDDVFRHIDAANVDLKAFSEAFYHKLTLSHLEPVKRTLLWLRNETDVWLEITTLLIPGWNDSPEEIKEQCDWILESLGDHVPLHYTAFHPDFRMLDRPRTPPRTLDMAKRVAREKGIKYVYVGNIHDPDGQTTYCPGCGGVLIERDWHSVLQNHLRSGDCPHCATKVPGYFPDCPGRRDRASRGGRPRRVNL